MLPIFLVLHIALWSKVWNGLFYVDAFEGRYARVSIVFMDTFKAWIVPVEIYWCYLVRQGGYHIWNASCILEFTRATLGSKIACPPSFSCVL